MKETLSQSETSSNPNLSSRLESQASDKWAEFQGLADLKDSLPHGQFRPALERIGLKRDMAHRFMSLRAKYPEMSDLRTFESVAAALEHAKQSETETELQRAISGLREATESGDAFRESGAFMHAANAMLPLLDQYCDQATTEAEIRQGMDWTRELSGLVGQHIEAWKAKLQ